MTKMPGPSRKAERTTDARIGDRTAPLAAASRKPKRHRARAPEEFKSSMLNIRVNDELKRKASATLAEIGISLPEAVRVFLGRVVSEQAFPFPLEIPNAETVEALRESRGSTRKRFTSAEEMLDDLEKGG